MLEIRDTYLYIGVFTSNEMIGGRKTDHHMVLSFGGTRTKYITELAAIIKKY